MLYISNIYIKVSVLSIEKVGTVWVIGIGIPDELVNHTCERIKKYQEWQGNTTDTKISFLRIILLMLCSVDSPVQIPSLKRSGACSKRMAIYCTLRTRNRR
jgi:hypothetical protein